MAMEFGRQKAIQKLVRTSRSLGFVGRNHSSFKVRIAAGSWILLLSDSFRGWKTIPANNWPRAEAVGLAAAFFFASHATGAGSATAGASLFFPARSRGKFRNEKPLAINELEFVTSKPVCRNMN